MNGEMEECQLVNIAEMELEISHSHKDWEEEQVYLSCGQAFSLYKAQ